MSCSRSSVQVLSCLCRSDLCVVTCVMAEKKLKEVQLQVVNELEWRQNHLVAADRAIIFRLLNKVTRICKLVDLVRVG